MRQPDEPDQRAPLGYQAVVLGISALVIVVITMAAVRSLQSLVGNASALSVGVTAASQVLGAAAPRGPAAGTLPGLVGTVTPSATPTLTPTRIPTPSPTLTGTVTPTLTPDVRTYDPSRAKALLAQAQTSWGSEPANFQSNVAFVVAKLNGRQVAPGTTFSFNTTAGPFDQAGGYRLPPSDSTQPITVATSIVDGGITQVSSTLFQAVFWAGLKIVDRQPHVVWLDRFSAGSTSQRGLDSYVSYGSTDLRFENNSGDWIRLDAAAQPGNITISIFGADPGWSVNPSVSAPANLIQPNPTPVLRTDPTVPAGQQFTVLPPLPGFDVSVQRTVTRGGIVIDRYGVQEHYQAQTAIISVGPTATIPPASPTTAPSPTPNPIAQNPTGPTRLAGLNPGSFVLPDGRIRVPSLVGVAEAEAQQVITAVGLATTYPNRQGPSDVSPTVLSSVEVGQVLSQNPAAGTSLPRGATVYIAVRKP